MADGKNGILVYADWIKKYEALSDEEAGRLVKHFFRYVNDLEPVAPDRLTELMFIDMKTSLQRDLKKWEGTVEDRSLNGRIGNLKRWNLDLYNKYILQEITMEEAEKIAIHRRLSPPDEINRPPILNIANIADSVSDTVTVSDTENDIKEDDDVDYKKPSSSNFPFFTLAMFQSLDISENSNFTFLACRDTKKTIEQVKVLSVEFASTQKALGKITWQDEADAKKHFINWAKKQASSEPTTGKKKESTIEKAKRRLKEQQDAAKNS